MEKTLLHKYSLVILNKLGSIMFLYGFIFHPVLKVKFCSVQKSKRRFTSY